MQLIINIVKTLVWVIQCRFGK